ncbi:hypothetical protein BP6252_13713 [Coleophoma cylindrospora]|uniref:Heterokaryon incompatibility domain-containing protein n=1 Tax=Coleophoma cylindrospora TaxID=1849047 RepID=A0A3D8Q751_9HELO|nr:hypothetical protein BP6252_13713 [Coleophoma cylindrospora]
MTETDLSAAKSIMMAFLAELKKRTDRLFDHLMLCFYIPIYLVVYSIFRISSLVFLAFLMLVNFSICCLLLWQASSSSVHLGYGSRLMGLTTTIKTKIDIMLAILFTARELISFNITPVIHLFYALFDPVASASSSLWEATTLLWFSRSNRVRMPPKPEKLHVISWAKETAAHSGIFQYLASTYSNNLWSLYNSTMADFLIIRFLRVQRAAGRVALWAQGLIAIMFTVAAYQWKSHWETQGTLYVRIGKFWVIAVPLIPPVVFFHRLIQDLRALRRREVFRVQKSNQDIYASLSITQESNSNDGGLNSPIRLLEICPGVTSQQISCRLRVADLADPNISPYEALSYVWGPPDVRGLLLVNSKPVRISIELYQALHRIRDSHQLRTVWVDALCINQANPDERSSQVVLMQQIYSRATSVMIWLGEQAPGNLNYVLRDTILRDETTSVMKINKDSVHYAVTHVIADLLRRPWWKRAWTVQELVMAQKATIYCGGDTIGWDEFCDLVACVASTPYFQSNDQSINDFQTLRDMRNERITGSKPNCLDENIPGATTKPRRLNDVLTVIYDFRARLVSEPRDKVFAFQALATQETSEQRLLIPSNDTNHSRATSQSQIPPNYLIYPDYNRRESYLCIDFSKEHIRQSRTLSVVALAESFAGWARDLDPETLQNDDGTRNVQRQYFPSWCPQFMYFHDRNTWHRQPFWTGLPGSQDSEAFAAAAAGNIPIQNSTLDSDGFFLDPERDKRVASSGARAYPHKLPVQILSSLRSRVTEIGPPASNSAMNLAREAYSVLEGQEKAFSPSSSSVSLVLPKWRRLAVKAFQQRRSMVPSGQSNPGCARNGNTSRVDAQNAALSDVDNVLLDEHFHTTITGGRFASLSNEDGMEAYKKARDDACVLRRLFITEDGYMGLGPAELRVGDEVNIMVGLQVPAVLRKCKASPLTDEQKQVEAERQEEGDHIATQGGDVDGNDYLYIGQAYVRELMFYDGDLAEDIRRERVTLGEILLV